VSPNHENRATICARRIATRITVCERSSTGERPPCSSIRQVRPVNRVARYSGASKKKCESVVALGDHLRFLAAGYVLRPAACFRAKVSV
jgi:hypothetical protein